MTTKRLQSDIDALRAENMKLKGELQALNENTVISSMNDMKKQYEQLQRSTVPLDQYIDAQDTSKSHFYMLKTVDHINSVILDDLDCLLSVLTRCQNGEMKHWA